MAQNWQKLNVPIKIFSIISYMKLKT